jgi:hypothetical protein
MSELYHRYDRAAVSDRITQPPFDRLADRGRRRAKRTRTVRLAGAAVLAALVAAPLLTLQGGNEPGTSGALAPPSEHVWSRFEILVQFYDRRHGVAHYAGEACSEGWVSATQDGGKTWSDLRELPDVLDKHIYAENDDGLVCYRATVIQIGPNTLVTPIAGGDPSSGLPNRPHFISHDAGRTWQRYQPQTKSADSVPAGVSPMWPCDDKTCKEAGLGWYDPRTGDWLDLKNQPAGVDHDALEVGFDGSIWAYGLGSGGELPLSVSPDRGRTWLDRPQVKNIDGLTGSILRVYDRNTAYLHAGRDPFFMYRTTDGGETWHPMPAARHLEDVSYVWINRDGWLVVDGRTDDQYISKDGGESFARTELPVRGVSRINGGFEGSPTDRAAVDPVDLYLSEDGSTWQPVEVPYYPGPDDDPGFPPSPGR